MMFSTVGIIMLYLIINFIPWKKYYRNLKISIQREKEAKEINLFTEKLPQPKKKRNRLKMGMDFFVKDTTSFTESNPTKIDTAPNFENEHNFQYEKQKN